MCLEFLETNKTKTKQSKTKNDCQGTDSTFTRLECWNQSVNLNNQVETKRKHVKKCPVNFFFFFFKFFCFNQAFNYCSFFFSFLFWNIQCQLIVMFAVSLKVRSLWCLLCHCQFPFVFDVVFAVFLVYKWFRRMLFIRIRQNLQILGVCFLVLEL